MDEGTVYSSDVAFTESVKAIQHRKGSRQAYRAMEQRGSWETRITHELATFIEAQTSVFLGTANALGQPYIQHRGGPKGFLKVLNATTIGFADYSGNRQYITQGNLADNPKTHLFLIDYAQRRRIKLWGHSSVVEDDPQLIAALLPKGYKAKAEQAIIFKLIAWNANCSQHIPERREAADVAAALAERDRRIELLENELKALRNTNQHGP
jgi:predicted pyridoxine 5'-phosphate oxidase superfamily flavin-nucleotide-binding protein